MVAYFYELSLDAKTKFDMEWFVSYTPYHEWFIFHNPSECLMFVPGTYDEMMKDYG